MPVWDRKYTLGLTRQKRRRAEALKSRFAALIAAPQALAAGIAPTTSAALTLPSEAFLGVSYSVPVTSGQLQLNTSTGRVLGTPDLAANEIHRIGFIERGVTVDVQLTAAVAGTATIHYLNGRRQPFAIATATFT